MVGRHETDRRIFLIEIFVDDGRFINDPIAVNYNGNFGVRIEFQKIPWLVFEIYFFEFVGNLFFRQDNPCPMGVGSTVTGVKFHEAHLLMPYLASYHRDDNVSDYVIDFCLEVDPEVHRRPD